MNEQNENDPLFSLLQRTSKGDREAFSSLYKATHQRIYVYLHRMVQGSNCIEDILAETYIQVWKSSNSFQGKSKVLTWMIGISRNLALKEIGKTKYHDDIQNHPEIKAGSIDPDEGCSKEILSMALGSLSIRHREILDLAFYQDLPYREIAHILDIPENTVKSRVFYAKRALRNVLEKMGINRSDI